MDIITNNQPRLLLDWNQLTAREQEEFDQHPRPEEQDYFRYKRRVYCLDDFTQPPPELREAGWIGMMPETWFSGIIIRHPTGHTGPLDEVVVGLALS